MPVDVSLIDSLSLTKVHSADATTEQHPGNKRLIHGSSFLLVGNSGQVIPTTLQSSGQRVTSTS